MFGEICQFINLKHDVVLFKKKISDDFEKNHININITNFPSGIYK